MRTSIRTSRYPGFTLVELLVVLGIIALVVALFLPAVQQAREAARRVQCKSNFRQIGLAVHSYHDSHGRLPPGGITMGHWRGTPSLSTWTLCLLPYLEQGGLYRRYDFHAVNEAPGNAFVREQTVPVYTCPSDFYAGSKGVPASGPGSVLTYATGSYRAVSGRSDGQSRPMGGSWFDTWNVLPRHWRGAMHHVGTNGLTTERMANIADGTSNTLLVGEYSTRECAGSNGVCGRTTFWAYTYTSYNQSSVCPECGARTLLADYDACAAHPGIGAEHACKRGWGSFHDGGLHFLLCDGSARFVSRNIDMSTLGDLATIAGGEVAAR